MKLFSRPGDYLAFEQVLKEGLEKHPLRLLGYCIMPNHWHLLLWPHNDGDLSKFMFWTTMTHVQRWRRARNVVGLGPLYQGRFRAFAVESDEHFLTVARYIERNPLRAKLVDGAEHWKWSSLHTRLLRPDVREGLLSDWPLDQPMDWLSWVNRAETQAELDAMRGHVRTGRPFGSPNWQAEIANRLGINLSPRPRGRPKLPADGIK